MMVVNFVISTKNEDVSLVKTGFYTTMETIIQAQQAAIITAITGVSAATTANSGNYYRTILLR